MKAFIKNKLSPSNSSIMSLEDYDKWKFTKHSDAYTEITYFTCLKLLSESLAKMPLKLHKDGDTKFDNSESFDFLDLLKFRPNSSMSSSTFWSTIEQLRNHYGNAYVLIRYDIKRKKYGATKRIKSFDILNNQYISVYYNDGSLTYHYDDYSNNVHFVATSDEILHFKTSSSFNGLTGRAVQDILYNSISTNHNSQDFLYNSYKNGVSSRMVLQYETTIDRHLKDTLIRNLEQYANGVENAGKIVPIPDGMELKPLDFRLTEAQFLEIRKYTALQIAGAFGVKPDMINDYVKSSYASSESQQLSFYVDTLQYILKIYEDELNYKLLTKKQRNDGYFFKFNEKVLLRTDSSTQAEMLSKYINNGIYTPNEARAVLDLPLHDDGNKLIVNGNYIPLDIVGYQYMKGGDEFEEV